MGTTRKTVSREALAGAQASFIDAWGKMGATWGISRTMAEIHALLHVTGAPMNTDEIMERLAISRGNASMSLRSLVEWGIVTRVHRRGDRKEYFQAEQDVWALCRTIIRERLRREIHPLLTSLYEVRDMTMGTVQSGPGLAVGTGVSEEARESSASLTEQVRDHNERLDELLELMQTVDRLAERFVGSEGKGLRLAASVLAKVS